MNPATIDQQRVEKIARRAGRLPVHVAVCEINKLHAEIITAARMSLDNAIRIGKLLTEVKGQLSTANGCRGLRKICRLTGQPQQTTCACLTGGKS